MAKKPRAYYSNVFNSDNYSIDKFRIQNNYNDTLNGDNKTKVLNSNNKDS